MKKGSIILIAVVLVIGIWLYTSYNGVVTLSNTADAQWAQVENAYQRRFDLIPNLVNSTKGFFTQEQTIYSDITTARAHYSGASTPDEQAAAANEVEGALGRLLVITESNPQIQSNQTVKDLMVSLEGTENRINVERDRFNEDVLAYNNRVQRFPTNIVAGLFGFHARTYFKSAAGAETAPTVNLQ